MTKHKRGERTEDQEMMTIYEVASDKHDGDSKERQNHSDCSLCFQEEDEGVQTVRGRWEAKRGDKFAKREDFRTILREEVGRVAAHMENMGGSSEEEWVEDSDSSTVRSDESEAMEDDDLGIAGLFVEMGSYDSREDDDYAQQHPAEESRGSDVNDCAEQQLTFLEFVPCTNPVGNMGQCTTKVTQVAGGRKSQRAAKNKRGRLDGDGGYTVDDMDRTMDSLQVYKRKLYIGGKRRVIG